MQIQETAENAKINTNAYRLISYSLVAAMIACAAGTIVGLASQINPLWQPAYLTPLCLIVALDRLYSYRISRNWMFLSRPWLILFGAHLVVIIALAKIVTGLSHGWPAFLTDMQGWGSNFPMSFLDHETGFSLVLALLTWILCGNFAEMLEQIGPDQAQMAHLDLIRKETIPVRQRLISLVFFVGAILVILTMIGRVSQRLDLSHYSYNTSIQIPILSVGGASTLLYFMLGLALLSQTQFISLHVRWRIQKIPVNGKLARQWAGYSLLFLTLIVVAVSLLPTSYGIQPLMILGYAINLLVYVVLYFAQLIFATFINLASLLFGKEPTADMPVFQQPETALPTPEPAPTSTGSNEWETIKVIIFWAIFLVVIFWGARQYLRQNREILAMLRNLPGWRFLTQFLGWLQSLFTQAKNSLEIAVQGIRERARAGTARQSTENGFINLRKLDPRRRVYFFYLAFVRRAGEKGLPRSGHQTPDEYAATLQSTLPDTAEDIHALTEAFVSARYSRQPVEAAQSQRVENIWARIRKTLRDK